MDEAKHRKENGLDQDGMWMVVEFLGHHKLAGFVTEEQKWGQVLLRIDKFDLHRESNRNLDDYKIVEDSEEIPF